MGVWQTHESQYKSARDTARTVPGSKGLPSHAHITDKTKWYNLIKTDPEFYHFCVDRVHWLRYSGTWYGSWLAVLSRSVSGYVCHALSGWDPLAGSSLSVRHVWLGDSSDNQYRSPVGDGLGTLLRIIGEELLRMHLAIQAGTVVATCLIVLGLVQLVWSYVRSAYTTSIASPHMAHHRAAGQDSNTWAYGANGYPRSHATATGSPRAGSGGYWPYAGKANRMFLSDPAALRQRSSHEGSSICVDPNKPSWLFPAPGSHANRSPDAGRANSNNPFIRSLKDKYAELKSRGSFLHVDEV